MKHCEKPISTLSSTERKFLGQLLEKEYHIIMRVTERTLGESYIDLRNEALSELHLLLIRKVEELQNHPSPEWYVYECQQVEN